MSSYLGFSTLTKAAFAFFHLNFVLTEQTSSHLNPTHQRAAPPSLPPRPPPSILGFLDVIQTSTGLLKSRIVNAQKVPVSSCQQTFTVNLISPNLRGANGPLCDSWLPRSISGYSDRTHEM